MEPEVKLSTKNAQKGKVDPPPKPPRLRADHQRHSHTGAYEATANEVLSVIITTTNTPHTAADTESDEKSLQSMPSAKRKKKKKLQFQSPLTNRSRTPPTSALSAEHTTYAIVRHDSRNVANVTETTTITPHSRRPTTTYSRAGTTHMLAAATATAPAAHPVSSLKAPFAAVEAEVAAAAAAAQSSIKNRLAHGCTSLMYACQHGDIAEVLEQLRSKPERIRQRDSRNKNALHYCAAQTRDLVAAASIAIAAPELLESADEDGFTPLHLAVIQGNLAMVNLLLANKADVNAVDNEGHSVVHWATVCGEVEALRSVLAAGANVATPDINGGSPLHYAAQMCGASYEGKLGQASSSKLAMEILGILLAHPQSSVDVQDKDGRQPLLWAASAGSAKAVIALVKAGARVESADKDGLTALHCAASRGHTECIDTLISLCGAPTDLIDSNGCTALHYAVTLGHADATSRLLELEADPNRQDRKGRTPAHCGCSKGQFETVKLLKERGANLWLRNAKGDLPVHEAASSGRRELVEWLLEQRSKQVNTTSNDGRSLLHIAAANDYTDMCKMVLDYGADINAIYRNSKGAVITPLDCSLQKGHRSTAKFLQSHGGLPAGKLRLAARRSNPFHEATTDVVRPLKYAEKEEIHDLRNSKKYVVYLKRSDSEGGAEDNCSCSEQTYKKEQRYEHRCHRHRQHSRRHHLRRRTSSCGDPKETCSGKDCSDICRSKSNIEIRRRKSRERYTSSTDLEEDEDGEEDSCENCCYHKRQKQRVVRRRSTSSRRSKDMKDSDEDDGHERSEKDSSPDKRGKRAVDSGPSKENNVEVVQEKPASSSSRPGSKTSTRSRPQSATKRQTPPPSAGKEGTFIKSPPQSAKADVPTKVEDGEKSSTNALELTDEEEQARAAEVVTTQVDVHRGADESSLKLSEEAEADEKKSEKQKEPSDDKKVEAASKDEVTEEITKEVDQVLKIAATAVNSESKSSEESQEGERKQSMTEESKETDAPKEPGKGEDRTTSEESPAKPTDEKEEANEGAAHDSTEKPNEEMKPPNLIETPATPMPTPTPSPTPTAANTPQATAPQTPQNEMSEVASVPDTPAGSAPVAATSPVATDLPAPMPSPIPSSPTSAPTAGTKPPATSTSNEPTPKAEQTAASASAEDPQHTQQQREQESRRSFTLLPSDSAEDEEAEQPVRKSSFQVLKSDESVGELDDARPHPNVEEVEFSDSQVFKIVHDDELSSAEAERDHIDYEDDQEEEEEEEEDEEDATGAAATTSSVRRFKGSTANRHGVGTASESQPAASPYDYSNGRKRRLKKRIKSGSKTRSNWKSTHEASVGGGGIGVGGAAAQQSTKDQDSGFEPSPRTTKSKIPTPRNMYTANVPRRPIYATLDGRTCSSRLEHRKPGDKSACDMSAVTRSIQRNIRRYYMERKIFQHLLELKSLQIRSNKLNEAVLVKRAVDDYHKSCAALGGETGTRLRRYSFSEYTFKNFELFLYETLKTLQKPGTYNFQNINEVYEEAERRLSPDYNAYEKALQCTTKTHRCLHAAHAYTGIPCAAYIPMMNHHTMPKFGFGPYKKTGVGSFYLPKILTSSHSGCGGKVALEVSHGKSKQLISLPSEKMDSNKRYYVTFTVKETSNTAGDANAAGDKEQSRAGGDGGGEAATK